LISTASHRAAPIHEVTQVGGFLVFGACTVYVQHESPGKERASNWLPALNGPFVMFMRIYWPKPEALDGTWQQPPLLAAK
jgi:Protein of unknown function (DUF1214)